MSFFRSLLEATGSLWFTGVLLVLLMVAMGSATVYESTHGSQRALWDFYHSGWFCALLALLALNVLAALLQRLPLRRSRLGFAAAHAGILLTLCGAGITTLWGVEGRMGLLEGETVREFSSNQSVLAVRDLPDGPVREIQLSRVPFQGFRSWESSSGPAVAVGDLQARVRGFLPDAIWEEEVVDDAPVPRPALQVSLARGGAGGRTWLFSDEERSLGPLSATFRHFRSAEEMRRFLAAAPEEPAAKEATVLLRLGGESFRFPLAELRTAPLPLDGTGYSVQLLRELSHAVVTSGGQVENASDEPINPAVEVEVRGPDRRIRRLAFARFPEFQSTHAVEDGDLDLKVIYLDGSEEKPEPGILLATAPGAPVYVRFQSEGSRTAPRELRPGKELESPWQGLQLRLHRRLEHARIRTVPRPVETIRDQREPALRVSLAAGGESTELWLRKYHPEQALLGDSTYRLSYRDEARPLGFDLTLRRFHIGHYPGTMRPRSFESHVTVLDRTTGRSMDRVIRMNHPLKKRGLTLFQSSYRQLEEGRVSYLSVARDPGQIVTFAGYLVTLAGMVLLLAERLHRAHRAAAAGCLALLMVPLGGAMVHAAWIPDGLDGDRIRAMVVQHDGRWPPVDTLARDMVRSVTGSDAFRGADPVLLLLAWSFDPETWSREPLIEIRHPELRAELQLPADRIRFSYQELVGHPPLMARIEALVHLESARKLDPLEEEVGEINEQLVTLQQIFLGEQIRPIPHPDDAIGRWGSVAQLMRDEDPGTEKVRGAWRNLGTCFLEGRAVAFAAAAEQLLEVLASLPAAHRPAESLVRSELTYNELQPFGAAWRIMLLGALLAAASLRIRKRWFDGIAGLVTLAGFGVLTYGLMLRWTIAGRIPAANMYESLLFLSWGMGAFAVLAWMVQRQRMIPLTAAAMGALALALADALPLDPFIRPIPPVLADTIWMSIHVPVIMVSYSVLALAVLIAHAQVVVMALAPHRQELSRVLDRVHRWYVLAGSLLLFAGIMTGSMWAASSWGRYWGWDPKEVWSLIALLAYLSILHTRLDRRPRPSWACGVAAVLGIGLITVVLSRFSRPSAELLLGFAGVSVAGLVFVLARGRFATAVKSILAFWTILMTYVGVNYVLGTGLHSYGFGTGAVAGRMLLVGAVDLVLILSTTGLYMIRRPGGA